MSGSSNAASPPLPNQRKGGFSTDENSPRMALPVYCGFDEDELLSEQYKK